MCDPPPAPGTNFTESETFCDTNTTDVANQTAFDGFVEQFAGALSVYYTPLLVALGTVGNSVSVFVFYSSKLRLQSTSQYLSALALSDTLFLFQLLPPWLYALRLSGSFNSDGFCQFFVYISYVTCCLSAWLVVAFTVERFVAVLYPLRRNAMCTVARARHVILALAAAAVLLNVPVLRFAQPTDDDCTIDPRYIDLAARFNLVDTAVTFTVPLLMIVVLNSWITVGVCRLERARQAMMKAERPAGAGAGSGGSQLSQRARPPRPGAGCPRSQQRVTRMLLIVSSVFVVLNVPAYTMRIIAYAYNTNSGEYGARWEGFQQVATICFNTNFGINFILYCLTGQNFRRALLQSIPWLRNRARRAVAVRRNTSHPARASSISASFVSNCTEATSNCALASSVSTAAGVGTPTQRRRRRDPFIRRWTFDNSQQSAPPAPPPIAAIVNTDNIEMRLYNTNYHI